MLVAWLALATVLEARGALLFTQKTKCREFCFNCGCKLAALCREGWGTREVGHDYLLWRPRELNKLADYYANKCMNEKKSWQWTWEGAQRTRSVPSYHIFTDGGRRDNYTPSAAWVIFIIINGGFKIAGTGGGFLEGVDSFVAEATAVERALDHWASLRVTPAPTNNISPWPAIDFRYSTILTELKVTDQVD